MVAHPPNATATPATFAEKVAVLLDGDLVLYFDRTVALNGAQQAAVASLEARLAQGFAVDGVDYPSPERLERVQFAASMIPPALAQDEETTAATALAYVCTRLPDVRQIHCRTRADGRYDIALITDRDYAPHEQPLTLHATP